MIEKREFYINGEWVAPDTPNDCAVINPSNEEPCAVISLGGQADTDKAVAAAKAAFPAWAATPPAERKALVAKILDQYHLRKEEMAQAISMEMGAPIDMSRDDQAECIPWHLGNFLKAFDEVEWIRPLRDSVTDTQIALEPIGVVGLITPWNWPMNQVTLKVIPALLAGCTIVLKPSEESPLSSMLFAEFIHDAGIPAGVFNLVNGDGMGVGTQLSAHEDVEMISFTGSTRAGRAISKTAAETMKRVTLELGGKGANLIFADADEKAVVRGVRHCFNNSGQSCNAPTRMLVERSIYDQAIEIAKETAEKTKVAPADQSGRHIGPVVNKRQWDQIQGYIQKGIDEGARLVAGGLGLPEGMNKGFYVRPTVFADVKPGMTIEKEEIFGPVLSIIPFDTEEEAIAIANDTPYGLTNYVQSTSTERRRRLSRVLRSGMVEMNGRSRAAGAPFGGVKASGRAREGGVWGIEEFLESKTIAGWDE
ncbi:MULTISPECIES: aldehyde dehydrogenase family protein [unclassified Marivivens]|jgi:aldehyde dehydrogenase (NAD+)|uniref:aldehyde dehydrogenase family protein n=1 Tax=unclassified Marivivens TaxID=2622455 RepID=UPI0007FD4CE8|nr:MULTISPECIES: aldehyde dehydrogenase family protein [unclassified Marivivens]MCL7404647.1 aldehyde dehydrogenase family protein [Marivivens geojensis]OBR35495.1 aldehyde dehydrogenase [Donghicola sp. JL3646]APO85561.1 aldehyde dehydrogenase family protein [Marivivens sp. JLT3646]NCW67539.1 aldehyde dehydrogenase family protein [Marivivens sp.]NVJ96285.1 aldehyde dehydrogenase family protein [Marivivens sp.]